jgi:hypothetical protein
MEIVDNKGAPPELIRIANKAASECKKVKRIIFDAFIWDLKRDLGAYDPKTETIIIDMGNCLMKRAWMKKGILFIPNVWFNLLFTFFHEMEHAFQLEEDPSLAELYSLPQAYEDEANITAEDSLLSWAKDGAIPRLNELGWVGNEIKKILNQMYAQTPSDVADELDVEGTTAVSNALHASLVSDQYENKEETALLFDAIDTGHVGTIVKGKRYFTAYDAINTTHDVTLRR